MNNRQEAFRLGRTYCDRIRTMRTGHRRDVRIATMNGVARLWRFLALCCAASLAMTLVGEHVLIVMSATLTLDGWLVTAPFDFTVRRWVHAVITVPVCAFMFWLDRIYHPPLPWPVFILLVGQSGVQFALFFCGFWYIEPAHLAWADAVLVTGYAGSIAGLAFSLCSYFDLNFRR